MTAPSAALLHPVRLRLVGALAAGPRTASQLSAALPDVPSATLYRQLGKLVEAGVLVVTATRPVRGAVEKTYTLTLEEAAGTDALRRKFLGEIAAQLSAFEAWLADPAADPRRDRAAFTHETLWLSNDELEMVQEGLDAALGRARAYGKAPWRKPRLVATVVLPG
jgi:DNA-binding transcriptional ArsR family regulator